MIGEALALALSGEVENALTTTQRAETFLIARAKEAARMWFIQGSFGAFLLFLFIGTFSYYIIMPALNVGAWFYQPVFEGVVFGAVGAQFSMLLRLNSLNVDPGAGRKGHYGEALTRILLGVFGAVIAVIAVQSDLTFGFIDHSTNSANAGNHQWWIPTIAIIAGASERIIPSFLHQMETAALGSSTNATEFVEEETEQNKEADKPKDEAQ